MNMQDLVFRRGSTSPQMHNLPYVPGTPSQMHNLPMPLGPGQPRPQLVELARTVARQRMAQTPRPLGPRPGTPATNFDTQLVPAQERAFKQWKARYAPRDSGQDYDLRGAFVAGLKPDPRSWHWPDTFKKPNHPTFSVESQYAKYLPQAAGTWMGNDYVPMGLM